LKQLRAQVGIIGAGPAGLTLGRLLERHGIDSVVLEDRSREYVEQRIRAGVLEQGSVDLLVEAGAADRLKREGIVHQGIELQFDGERHRVPLSQLTGGRRIVIYGQTEVVKDLIAARLSSGAPLLFEVDQVRLGDLAPGPPQVNFRHNGEDYELRCDVIAGCDGYHGPCRGSVPPGVLRSYSRDYPYAWLGILAAVAPSNDELIYANHEVGFALLSMRSSQLSRLYVQCRPDDDIANWPDDRIWEQLQLRLGLPGWQLTEGTILEKGITGMRSLVYEPMQYGHLYLAGDATHIVPPTGAKGLNLALHDVGILAEALVERYSSGSSAGLESYSQRCLRRVWRAEHFSWWMTSMLHRAEDGNEFERQLQLSQLRYIFTSEAAATTLAENYVGLAGG
jgi:p-hydroxybenzoate 3-monooxygenase